MKGNEDFIHRYVYTFTYMFTFIHICDSSLTSSENIEILKIILMGSKMRDLNLRETGQFKDNFDIFDQI